MTSRQTALRAAAGIALLTCVSVGATSGRIRDARVAAVAEPAQLAPPSRGAGAAARRSDLVVALLATEPEGAGSELYLLPADGGELPAPALRLAHRHGAAVRGAITGDSAHPVLLAVADLAPGSDRSFGSALLRVEPGRAQATLAEGVVYASRPVLASPREVLISTGSPGVVAEGTGRVDALRVDVVDPESGATRTLLSEQGFLLYVVGVLGREALIYRVAPARGDLCAVDLDSGALRALGELPPLARDFSLDPERRELAFVARGDDAWQALSIDLDRGDRAVLGGGPSMLLLPQRVAGELTLVEAGRTRWLDHDGPPALPAPGALHVNATLRGVSAGLVVEPGKIGVPVVFDGALSDARRLPAPSGMNLAVAGLLAKGDAQ